MQVSVQDTIPAQISDTNNVTQPDYYVGTIIPIDSSGDSFPDTLITSNLVYASVYTNNTRFQGDPLTKKPLNSDFCFGILAFSLIMLAILFISGRKALFSSLASLSLKRPFILPLHGALGVFSWPPVLTTVFSFLNISLFLIVAGVSTGMTGSLPGNETIKITALIFAALLTAMLLRHLICIVTGNMSGQKTAFREYIAVIGSCWFILGIIAFLLSSLILFIPYKHPEHMVWAGASVFALLYFYRILRLFIIFIKQNISILYFILYLCALEVLPVLIVLKLLGAF